MGSCTVLLQPQTSCFLFSAHMASRTNLLLVELTTDMGWLMSSFTTMMLFWGESRE